MADESIFIRGQKASSFEVGFTSAFWLAVLLVGLRLILFPPVLAEDMGWFVALIFGLPLVLVGGGLLMGRVIAIVHLIKRS